MGKPGDLKNVSRREESIELHLRAMTERLDDLETRPDRGATDNG